MDGVTPRTCGSQIQDQSMSEMLLRWEDEVAEEDRPCSKHGNDTAHQCGNRDCEIEHCATNGSNKCNVVVKYE